mgnify:CR=1 FL=1
MTPSHRRCGSVVDTPLASTSDFTKTSTSPFHFHRHQGRLPAFARHAHRTQHDGAWFDVTSSCYSQFTTHYSFLAAPIVLPSAANINNATQRHNQAITQHLQADGPFNHFTNPEVTNSTKSRCSTNQRTTTRNTQHATRNTQHATRNTQHATSNTQHDQHVSSDICHGMKWNEQSSKLGRLHVRTDPTQLDDTK